MAYGRTVARMATLTNESSCGFRNSVLSLVAEPLGARATTTSSLLFAATVPQLDRTHYPTRASSGRESSSGFGWRLAGSVSRIHSDNMSACATSQESSRAGVRCGRDPVARAVALRRRTDQHRPLALFTIDLHHLAGNERLPQTDLVRHQCAAGVPDQAQSARHSVLLVRHPVARENKGQYWR